jgi:hypothetical protein
MMASALPSGFEALEPFVAYWAGETTQTRWDRRSAATMDEIKRFYNAMLEHADEALERLQPRPLNGLDEDEGRLLRLLLSLASCAIAVELHGQPRAPLSPFPHGIRVLQGSAPFG